MKIKRFFAPDMRQAIRQVRDEQGPDAVILSTRTTAEGVEIVAAVDYDAELVNGVFGEPRGNSDSTASPDSTTAAAPAAAARPSETPPEADEDRYTPAARADKAVLPRAQPRRTDPSRKPESQEPPRIEWAQDPALAAMQAELASLRGILQDQVTRLATADYDRREPVRAEIVRRLVKLGFDEAVARGVAAGTTDLASLTEAWREALFRLATRLPVAATDPIDNSHVIALIGATGVGKTTTAAKLAARACLRYGSQAVALISTDDFRVGAQRQLASFGLLLGLPVRQARSGAELTEQLAEFSSRRIVIIDTAGMGQRDVRLIEELRKLAPVADLQSYLVMSANVQREVMDEVIDAYGRDQLAGCILTKLDEAARLGPALSTVLTHQLPIAYLSEGQRVPEDLKIARTKDLLARALAVPGRLARDGKERHGAGVPGVADAAREVSCARA